MKFIELYGVKQNNLKNITVQFPFKKISVVTGVSGSGKSSLAFDTLYAEGQRRFVESLSTYTRQFLEKMPKPELESIKNIPPAIALEQKNSILNSRSTVGTQTEILDYLRLFFARCGKTICPECNASVESIQIEHILQWLKNWLPNRKVIVATPFQLTSKKIKKSSVIEILQSQGFHRLLLFPTNASIEKSQKVTPDGRLVDTSDITLKDLDGSNKIFVVLDRLKVSHFDDENQNRMREASEKAFLIGQNQVFFYDIDSGERKLFNRQFACTQCTRTFKKPEPNLFNFNSPIGACDNCSGFGHILELDEALVVPDPNLSIKNGAIDPFTKPSFSDWQKDLLRFCDRHGISLTKKYSELKPSEKKLLWLGHSEDKKTFPGIFYAFEELKKWKYKLHIRVFIRRYQSQSLCESCKGTRIKSDALAVKLNQLNIHEVLDLPLDEALHWLKSVQLTKEEVKIASDLFLQLTRRIEFLNEVGVNYLTLSRPARTLSGGEFQRINLATQLGNGLCGTLYVLDEPSIGLHSSDTEKLIRILKRLRDQGNTVVVVEHDLEIMKTADYIVELGPFAGRKGGQLVAQGNAEDVRKIAESLTGQYLNATKKLKRDTPERARPSRFIKLTQCRENNLKNIDVEFPLNRFVVVTGVSGSGKSTLVHKTLYQAVRKIFEPHTDPIGQYDRLYGASDISGVVLLDQSPIGKSSRSNPATYLKIWDEIRKIYSQQPLALKRGYTPQYFSFNVDGGRCPVCKGEGEVALDMHFMADLKLPCEECQGKRFKKNILDVYYRGKNIDQLLHTTIDEAYDLYRDYTVLTRKLRHLKDVGLGYLLLGQSSSSMSGGESQRLKIASTLDEKHNDHLLYIFDEPTTGLHLEDIQKLLTVIQDLVSQKQSVIMIEHHMDVIAQADWVIDIGPQGGTKGGELVASGTPAELARNIQSETGRMLRELDYFPATRSE